MNKRHLTAYRVNRLFGLNIKPNTTDLDLIKNGLKVSIRPVKLNETTPTGTHKKRFRVSVCNSI